MITPHIADSINKLLDKVPEGTSMNLEFNKNSSGRSKIEMKINFTFDDDQKQKAKAKKYRFKTEDLPFMKRAMSSSTISSATSFKGKKLDAPIPVRVHNLPTFKPKDEQYYAIGPMTAADKNSENSQKRKDLRSAIEKAVSRSSKKKSGKKQKKSKNRRSSSSKIKKVVVMNTDKKKKNDIYFEIGSDGEILD